MGMWSFVGVSFGVLGGVESPGDPWGTFLFMLVQESMTLATETVTTMFMGRPVAMIIAMVMAMADSWS